MKIKMFPKFAINNILPFSFFLGMLLMIGCKKDKPIDPPIVPVPIGYIDTTLMVDVGGYSLYCETKGEGSTTIVFENGLGGDFNEWKEGVYDGINSDYQLIIYNRGGYLPSEAPNNSINRDINQLAKELKIVIDNVAQNEKVILVGHSLGGPIIRSFVHQFPDQAKAMLFVDTAHEDEYDANSIQTFEDYALDVEIPNIPQLQHVRAEVAQLSENWAIQTSLPDLPNIPVTVLTAMSLNDDGTIYTTQERQDWFDLHASLGEGVDDFTHESSTEVGHHIHIDDPTMVINGILGLIN